MFSRDARGHMVHAGGVGWVLRELTGGGGTVYLRGTGFYQG